MGQAILRAISTALARVFGPQAGKWVEENGVPVFGILGMILLGFCALTAWMARRDADEGGTDADRQRNRRYGRWTAAVLLLTGFALMGRSLTFGTFEEQKVQEVVWSITAGALGTTAWVLLMAWSWPALTKRERWKMRAGLLVPLSAGIVLAMVGVFR